MREKRFEKSKSDITDYRIYDYEKEDAYFIDCDDESTVDAIVDLLNEQDRKIRKLEQENKALESNVKWFAHQLEKHYTLYSDDFLETLETMEGEETVEKIRERQNEIIKILKKEELL